MANDVYRASTTAPVNIAVIKYWGKRNATLNLPTNSSLSVTLSQDDLKTHTTASCSESFTGPDTLQLNGQPQSLDNARSRACLDALRSLRADVEAEDASLPRLSGLPLRIASINNFPTAAGLASSAAGFAALVRAVANLYQLPQTETELSLIARQGSGSACRSLMGGYVAWDMGNMSGGSDSLAREIAPASHWPDMCALILVACADKKAVSSTAGMQNTVKTSSLFKVRAQCIVPCRMTMMEQAIQSKDFTSFAKLTMQDSNSFHACCLDTSPPIFYLNETSRAAIQAVEVINASDAGIIAAYTFDAGPNAVIYYQAQNRDSVVGAIRAMTGPKDGFRKDATPKSGTLEVNALKDGVSCVIETQVGEGPIRVDDHLIDIDGNLLS